LPPGQRDNWLFLAAVAIIWIAPPSTLRREIHGMAEVFAGWRDSETRSRMKSVID
jgi:truncated hemoglobin YjbI